MIWNKDDLLALGQRSMKMCTALVVVDMYATVDWVKKLEQRRQHTNKYKYLLLGFGGLQVVLWLNKGWIGLLLEALLVAVIGYWFAPRWLRQTVNWVRRQPATNWHYYVLVVKRVEDFVSSATAKYHVLLVEEESGLADVENYGASTVKLAFVGNSVMSLNQLMSVDECLAIGAVPAVGGNDLYLDLQFLLNHSRPAYVERLANAKMGTTWPPVAAVLHQQESIRATTLAWQRNEDLKSLVKSDKALSILKSIDDSKDWGIALWNLNKIGIKESANALVVRVSLLGDTTVQQLKKSLPAIAKEVRVGVELEELKDKGSANLIFALKSHYYGKRISYGTLTDLARQSLFPIGVGDLGEVTLKLPHVDFPAVLIGGLSRSGKSTLATMLMVSMLSMSEPNGSPSYQDVYIGTVKDEDYKALGWDKLGMSINGSPQEVYRMLTVVDEECTNRKAAFVRAGVVNIKQYNAKHVVDPMAKMLVVVDEYANLLSRAEAESVNVDGKDVKLNKEIERLCVKIGQEHISRGATLIIITQNFAKNALGRVYDAVGAKIGGYAPTNVLSSWDASGELAKVMSGEEQTRQGLFVINAPDLIPTDDTLLHKMANGFYKVRTNYVDTADVKKYFKQTYQTASRFSHKEVVEDHTTLPIIVL